MHRVVTLALQIAQVGRAGADHRAERRGEGEDRGDHPRELRRAKMPFIKVNAGALPDQLLESELFGAEAGAYTGSTQLRLGRFEAADGGTLFLDEIGNLSPLGQTKLLRVLQSGEFERLGSSQTRRVDVRLLAATNADLREAIARGTLPPGSLLPPQRRRDHVPPLRDRRDDILPLARGVLCRRTRAHRSRPYADARPAARSALALRLARQRPRAAEPHARAPPSPRRGDDDHSRDLGLGSTATRAAKKCRWSANRSSWRCSTPTAASPAPPKRSASRGRRSTAGWRSSASCSSGGRRDESSGQRPAPSAQCASLDHLGLGARRWALRS